MYNRIDFLEFQKMFSTEKRCWQYLFKKRWPNGYICPKCGCNHYYFISTRALYQCKACRYQCSVTAGTIFHKTRTPLVKLFWMIYFIAHDKNGHSALDLTRKLKISYKVAWTMSHKIREAIMARDAHYQLAGLVELDDAFFGGKNVPGPRGRGAANKVTVLVAAQVTESNQPKYASMQVIENLQKENVQRTVKDIVQEGASIKTDAFSSLKTLKECGYEHLPEVIGEPKNASKVLPWVHTFIANAKSIIIGTYKGVSCKYMQRYLSEFCYRLNRRFDVDQIFDRLIIACIEKHPVTIAELRA